MGNQNYTDITHLVKKVRKNKKIKELLPASLRWTLLIIIFITFSFLLNFYFNQENNREISQSQVLNAAVPILPVLLTIPIINVNANIQYVGVTQAGEMEVPTNAFDVGWFKLGPRPGVKGSAVISGHFDDKNGQKGVFSNLYKLKKGNSVYIENGKKKVITFVVRGKRIYDPGYADDVFSASDNAHLNLITCDGVWDGVKKSYSKRLVVFADIMYNN